MRSYKHRVGQDVSPVSSIATIGKNPGCLHLYSLLRHKKKKKKGEDGMCDLAGKSSQCMSPFLSKQSTSSIIQIQDDWLEPVYSVSFPHRRPPQSISIPQRWLHRRAVRRFSSALCNQGASLYSVLPYLCMCPSVVRYRYELSRGRVSSR